MILVLIVFTFSHSNNSGDSKAFGETTMVTAFFDIGRGDYKLSARSRNIYINYFKGWARIKNPLFAYCGDENTKNEILAIRGSFGLGDETKVEVIDDVYSIEKEMYAKMVLLSRNSHFLNFRVGKNDEPENKAEYNYVTNLKTYFLLQATIENNINTENVAWIDFGYDHGGYLYPFEEDWSFMVECNTSNKIQLFYASRKIDQRPMFEIIRTLRPCCITSYLIVCPLKFVNSFWTLVKNSINYALDIGFMDDDQTFFLLASRLEPELFELRRSFWYLPVKQFCNGGHMRIKGGLIKRMNIVRVKGRKRMKQTRTNKKRRT